MGVRLLASMVLPVLAWPLAFAATAQTPTRPEAPALRRITVYAGAAVGTLRSLQGVNGAPAPGSHKPPDFTFGGWNMPEQVDVTRGYVQARIDLVRTHDAYGPTDIDALFGPNPPPPGFDVARSRTALVIFPDPAADPTSAASYHFGPSDRVIASIEAIGAAVLFRLGRSETSAVSPPADFARYAEVAAHIVSHYNAGWDNGFRYGIRYWEIWNEPDLGRLFWGGTAPQYFELYAQLARAIKRADPRALVGGPTLAKPNDDTPYQSGFLNYVREHHLPLDFYAWHWYATDSNDPLDFARIAREVRARLDRAGFPRTLSVLDEWNYGLSEQLPSDLQRACFVSAALSYMQDAPIDRAALYRADNLFGTDGASPNKTGAALIAHGKLEDTPLRLHASGGDTEGFAVLAGRTADRSKVQILITNYRIPPADRGPRAGRNVLSVPNAFDVSLLTRRSPHYAEERGYELSVEQLDPGRPYVIERYRIDERHTLELLERSLGRGSSLRVQALLPAPALELIVIAGVTAPRNSDARAAPRSGRQSAGGS